MGTCGVVCAVTCPVGWLTSTLGGGDVGGLFGWRVDGGLLGWLTSWCVGWFVGWLTSWSVTRFMGWLTRRSLLGRVGSGSRGLKLAQPPSELSEAVLWLDAYSYASCCCHEHRLRLRISLE